MRENNFSIPNANKASVGITPALYDRRALDCTSTLPLINSLNNLAYLTTSSARIRDILTVDGGVERLVCILKEGRSKDSMEMWKWNLAFQCVVNIGVRGSEGVRTRVVEADMVPVVATILDNYIQAIDKCREREASRRSSIVAYAQGAPRGSSRSSRSDARASNRSDRSRRQAPPPIAIPQTPGGAVDDNSSTADITQAVQSLAQDLLSMTDNTADPSQIQRDNEALAATHALASLAERTTDPNRRQRNHEALRALDNRQQFSSPLAPTPAQQREQMFGSSPFGNNVSGFGIRPVRDVDRLPSMVPNLGADLSSQPVSPSTPNAPVPTATRSQAAARTLRRPSIRHQLSVSGTNWEDE